MSASFSLLLWSLLSCDCFRHFALGNSRRTRTSVAAAEVDVASIAMVVRAVLPVVRSHRRSKNQPGRMQYWLHRSHCCSCSKCYSGNMGHGEISRKNICKPALLHKLLHSFIGCVLKSPKEMNVGRPRQSRQQRVLLQQSLLKLSTDGRIPVLPCRLLFPGTLTSFCFAIPCHGCLRQQNVVVDGINVLYKNKI